MPRLRKQALAKTILDSIRVADIPYQFAEQGVTSVTALRSDSGMALMLTIRTQDEGIRAFEVRVKEVM